MFCKLSKTDDYVDFLFKVMSHESSEYSETVLSVCEVWKNSPYLSEDFLKVLKLEIYNMYDYVKNNTRLKTKTVVIKREETTLEWKGIDYE